MMNREFEKLSRHFGINNPKYDTNLVGMVDVFDERVWQKFPIDVRTIWMGKPDNFKKTRIGEGQYQLSDFGYIMKETPMYNEFYDWPLKGENMTPENIRNSLWWPDAFDPGRIRGLRNMVKALYDDTDFVIKAGIPVNGFLEQSQRMRGMENFFIDLYENERLVNTFLDKQMEVQKKFYNVYLREIGKYIQVIEYADDFGTQTGLQISLELYRKYFKERHMEMWRYIHNLTNAKIYLHSCGAVSELIPDWIENGLDILESLQPLAKGMDAKTLKDRYGGKIIFWGGLDVQRIMPFGNPDEVRAEVKRIIQTFAPGGGYIFSPAHAIQNDVSIENWLAMWEAVDKYGKYPINLSY
jgi:uroporphyrinogen decarboxylase